jgi:uncharacterized protein (TIGR02598 family)
MKTKHLHLTSRGTPAFTLIEITLALSLISFAFVGLMGLLPLGLQNFQSAIDISIRSQIAQRIFTDASQTDFDTLVGPAGGSTPTPTYRYFDNQGNEVFSQQGAVYQAQIQVIPSTGLPSSPSSQTNPDLATVQISIANRPGQVYSGTTQPPPFVTATLVARNEHL